MWITIKGTGNESITWNRTAWDDETKTLYVESWHKRRNQPASTAHRVYDPWEKNSQHVRAGDSHFMKTVIGFDEFFVIGTHLESLPSGFVRTVRTSTDWCNPLSW